MEVSDKMWKHEAINIRAVLDNLDEELKYLEIEDIRFREIAKGLEKEGHIAIDILCSRIEQFIDRWNKYTASYNEAVEKDITELEDRLEKAEKRNNNLNGYCRRLEKENEILREELKTRDTNEVIIKRAAELMDLIDGRANMLASSKAIFERQKNLKPKGEESPRFNSDIDTDTLVDMYKASGYTLTKEILQYYKQRNIKVTYGGLRFRLINAKVWKQGQQCYS